MSAIRHELVAGELRRPHATLAYPGPLCAINLSRLDKKIHRHSNVELLDIIKTSKNQERIILARTELNNRNLNQDQMATLEIEYQQYRDFKEKRLTESLTTEEFFHFFFFSVFTSNKWGKNHVANMEYERFAKYGYNKKRKEAAQAQLYGFIFWILITIIIASLFRNF